MYFFLFSKNNFMNKLKLNDFFKIKNKKQFVYCQHFIFVIYKITPLPLRGKVGPLSKKKRVLCWSIYISSTYEMTAS